MDELSNIEIVKQVIMDIVSRAIDAVPAVPATKLSHTDTLGDMFSTLTMRNGKQILKIYSSPEIRFNIEIRASNTTYFGMSCVLRNIASRLLKNNLDPWKYCVLCPHYLKFQMPHSGKWRGGDTQAGGGGKVAIDELPCVGAREEMIEELRIIGDSKHQHLESEIISSRISDSKEAVITVTRIYSFPVSTCIVPKTYDTSAYADPDRRGVDNYNNMIGFVPWGTIDECMKLISEIPVDTSDILVDKIIGIAIVSLPKAIEMAQHASRNLRGKIASEHYPAHSSI